MDKKIEKKKEYCKTCNLRNRVIVDKKLPAFDQPATSPVIGENVAKFCGIGYTQIPKTKTSTLNVAKANGIHSICPRNPWKNALLARIGK